MAYEFTLPNITDLTVNQQAVLNEINPVKVSGAPGTGKSVVTLWRFLQKRGTREKVLLLTYTKTLERYFKGTVENIDAKASTYINGTSQWCCKGKKESYDEILIDEAQDVGISNYETIKKYTKADSAVIFFPQ